MAKDMDPTLIIDGPMQADTALNQNVQEDYPFMNFEGPANVLVLPNLAAANIAYNLLKANAGGDVAIGPFLLGINAPVHILTGSSTVWRIINMTALTVVNANALY